MGVHKRTYTTAMSFTFKIHGRNLPVMDKGMEGGSADPYFKLYVDGDKVYESDKISNTLNPEWEEFTLDREVFGGMPKIVDIKIKVKDSLGATATTTWASLISKSTITRVPLNRDSRLC